MTNEKLIELAKAAMKNAYAPYSSFKVGAALLSKSGKIYTGCNIENSSFSITNCAERIVGGKNGVIEGNCYPCGACRQALSEFVDNSFKFIFVDEEGNVTSSFMEDLLPCSFNL